ncbi:MAG: hypothetical protein JWM80_2185, partial [Cyanobacteria bacterium RYN_339]|nr:hypothetical protein [Cyanobacteria bacterium RYN_339]
PAQAEALAAAARALPDLAAVDRLALALALADAWRNLGRAQEAFALFEAEIMPALRAASPPDFPRHVITFGVLHQAVGRYAAARTLWAEAIALADAAGMAHESVRARIFAGRLAFFEGNGPQALAHFEAAVAQAKEANLEADQGWALALKGHMLGTLDHARLAEGLACLGEARDIQVRLGNHVRLFEAFNDEGNLLLGAGRPLAAREVFERCLSIGAIVGPQEAVYAHLNFAFTRLELGEAAQAKLGAAQVTELAQRLGGKLPESFAAAVEGLALVRVGSPVLGWARLERALALAGELGNRYAELAAGALAVEAMVELGRWESARPALGHMRGLAQAAGNHEHDGRFARLEATLDVLGRAPTARDRVTALVEAARARGSSAELAHALRWQAEWQLGERQWDLAGASLHGAEEQAKEAGLAALPAELALLQGELNLAQGQGMFAGFALLRGLDLAQKLELGPLAWRIKAALAEADPTHRPHGDEARARYQQVAGTFGAAEREAYGRMPGHQRLG